MPEEKNINNDNFIKADETIKFYEFDTNSTDKRFIVETSNGKRLNVSEAIVKLLKLLNGKKNNCEIAEEFSRLTGKKYTSKDINQIVNNFLIPHGLLDSVEVKPNKTRSQYLFLKIPLLSQNMLSPLTSKLKFLFNWKIFLILISLIMLFHIYFYFFFDKPSFNLDLLTSNDYLVFYTLIVFSSLFHELGHSTACSRFGAQHGKIGMGLYLYFFIFYADVSDAWKLNRKERVLVDLGGNYFQLLLLPLFFLLFLITKYNLLIFFIFLVNLQSITNLNPILRFDGYWLVSDMIGIPNFRKRTQELTAYWINKLFRKEYHYPKMLRQVKKSTMVSVYIYTLTMNLFFSYFFYRILLFLPDLFVGLPSKIITFINNLILGFQTGNFKDAFNSINYLILPVSMLMMIALIIYQITKSIIYKRIKSRFVEHL